MRMGAFLGYPACCQNFFNDVWVGGAWIDTTWPMACNGGDARLVDKDVLEVRGPLFSNILLRWLGVRAVPHLPCSFSCEASAAWGGRWTDLGMELGFADEIGWLREMLEWPVEWSALHGIAEIKTPVVKTSARTTSTSSKLTVRRPGATYPESGATGLHFPFQAALASRSSRQRDSTAPESESTLHRDNGFATLEAMHESHRPIIELATKILSDINEPRVIDFGCGNGALLREIAKRTPGCQPVGIEIDPRRAAKGSSLLSPFRGIVNCGDMFDEQLWKSMDIDLAILMPGRLLEVKPETAASFLRKLKRQIRYILLYMYEDLRYRRGTLSRTAKDAGLELLEPAALGIAARAKVLE